MLNSNEIAIRARDLDDIRQVLAAALNYCQATDLANAQMQLEAVAYRPLTTELGRIKQRVDGYMGDYALSRLDADSDFDGPDPVEDADDELGESEEAPEALTEDAEGEMDGEVVQLAMRPLGTGPARRAGRRLSAGELAGEEAIQDGAGD